MDDESLSNETISSGTGITGQLRVLTLNEGENNESKVFRLEKGWTLHFVLGSSLSGKQVSVFTNHPENAKAGSNRNVYRELKWKSYGETRHDPLDMYAELHLITAGSFNYYCVVNDKRNECRGYILVDPMLVHGRYDLRLPLDAICCLTVQTKLLGSLDEWEGRLQTAFESQYNMLHFTPLQSLGMSNSAYCIKDQLQLNPLVSRGKHSWSDVKAMLSKFKDNWDMLSSVDIVLNHTANESPWLLEHPESAYNMQTAPHLKPAFLLDRVIWHLSEDIAAGNYRHLGLPPEIRNENHLQVLQKLLEQDLVPKLRLHEFYMMNIDQVIEKFKKAIIVEPRLGQQVAPDKQLRVNYHPQFHRLSATVDMPVAARFYYKEGGSVDEACRNLRAVLEALNQQQFQLVIGHIQVAIINTVANARWRFLDPNGPKVVKVLHQTGIDPEPIMWNYFTLSSEPMTVEEEESVMHSAKGAFFMAHNGWVMGDDPLRNFASPDSLVYLRRELLPWGDNVKLRFGERIEDSPFLWEHMRKYTVEMAKLFHGIRLDNCHSTPIHVAEYMLDEARKIRPNLYVIAELFTSGEYMDNLFINRLGINSLIRESLNASDPHDLGRLVHRYGGYPVGSFLQPPARPLTAGLAHALFFDQTHDNPSPVEKRTVLDVIPNSGLVAMACCATGSNMGYDTLVPHHISVVKESRSYPKWSENNSEPKSCNLQTGIIRVKKELNKLHKELGNKGYTEVFVDQVAPDIIAVTRHNPVSHQSVIMVARCCFDNRGEYRAAPPFTLSAPGTVEHVIFECRLVKRSDGQAFKKNPDSLNGLTDYELIMKQDIPINNSDYMSTTHSTANNIFSQVIEFKNFFPGCIAAFRIKPHPHVRDAILNIRQTLALFGYRMHTLSARNIRELSKTGLETILMKMNFDDLNRALFRCSAEEIDDGFGFAAYNVPGYGELVYCGLQGVHSVLNKVRAGNDLGHPLCSNLRDGNWLMMYLSSRLQTKEGTKPLGDWLEQNFGPVMQLPRYLVPCYFDAIVTGVYMLTVEIASAKMSRFVSHGSTFNRHLALGSIQMCSVVPSALLPPLSPNLKPPTPVTTVDPDTGNQIMQIPSLAAGLPHFSSGIWRNWGRDTFISLRGLLLLTGRYFEARRIILSYAGTLRHGLIPNLLGGGIRARYNCRDALWWWFQCIQEYCQLAEDGYSILNDTVSRMYPKDDSQPLSPGQQEMQLLDVIQEALQVHAKGLTYQERDAGPELDVDMTRQGFTVTIGVDWQTGFVFGGSEFNCGTWMDKMGSSEKAGNKGLPATPRDGSAVELVALCYSAVRFMAKLFTDKLSPHKGVQIPTADRGSFISYKDWAELIKKNFENYFFIPVGKNSSVDKRPDLINRVGIYKDVLGSKLPWTDYQLRCNFPIAMVVAPELFTPSNAWLALSMAEELLLGPLGMKTLDPKDWAYNGVYNNADDSTNKATAKGWNYHQGPEWLWPVGYFFRAKIAFAKITGAVALEHTVQGIRSRLSQHCVHVQNSDWKSLPELTNQNGQFCPYSCHAQAWSVGTILEVLYDLDQL